jgi:hypothetical protein
VFSVLVRTTTMRALLTHGCSTFSRAQVLNVMEDYKHLTPIQSRLAFLDTCAREFLFYGASFYACTVISDTNILTTLGSDRLLAGTSTFVVLDRCSMFDSMMLILLFVLLFVFFCS